MKLGVVGCGPVGLAWAATFAAAGHDVTAIEVEPERLARLRRAEDLAEEPGLGALIRDGLASDRLRFSGALDAVAGADVIAIAVPTPFDVHGGGVDAIRAVAAEVARSCSDGAVLVVRSTVPPGTTDAFAQAHPGCAWVALPEFLRSGHALADFRQPARVLVGTRSDEAARRVAVLFGSIGQSAALVHTTPIAAELAKLASNTMLAMRVAFANEVASLAESLREDPSEVLRLVALDPRIGPSHLEPSWGFGGPCLPKDVRGMVAQGRTADVALPLIEAVAISNALRVRGVVDRLQARWGSVSGRTIAVLGLGFKRGSPDLRESAAVALVELLLERGARVVVHDPTAVAPPAWRGRVQQVGSEAEAASLADAVLSSSG